MCGRTGLNRHGLASPRQLPHTKQHQKIHTTDYEANEKNADAKKEANDLVGM
jgi:hypothetical protein